MRALNLLIVMVFALSLSGCEAIGRIFQAGIWVGVIGVLVILALVWMLVSRTRR